MVSTCAIADCKNSASRRKKPKDLIFHRFPKPSSLVHSAWINKCKRDDSFSPSPQNSAVCSDHFLHTDYKRDLENELLGLPPRKHLKPEAIPSVFPNRSQVKNDAVVALSSRGLRVERRQSKRYVEEMLEGE